MNPSNTGDSRPPLAFDLAWFAFFAVVSSVWIVTASQVIGVTFDEPFYMANGLSAWRTGTTKPLMTKGVMTLPPDVHTLPVYVWEQWRGKPFDSDAPYVDLHTILPVARLANLPFWWLFLLYAMRWGRLLGGPWAGRLAVAFVAVEPNFLGHAALATTDIPLVGTVLLATYHFFTNRESPWPRRVLIPGLLYGVAMTAKASAMPYVPLLMFVFGFYHLSRNRSEHAPNGGTRLARFLAWSSRLRWDWLYIVLIGFAFVIAYTGCDWTTEPTFVDWATKLPDGTLKSVMLPVAENLRIFPNAGEGLIQQVKHNFRGHTGSFLLGHYYTGSVWYYFPVALTVKLPDATLILFAVVVLTRFRSFFGSAAGWAVLVLLLFSFNTKVQIGVRLVFPMVAFLYIGMAVALCTPGRGRAILAALAALGMAGTAVEAVGTWPDGVRFTNQLYGGPSEGWRNVSDSNYDWGQGTPELKAWWAANGEPPIAVWYYGGDTAAMLPPFRLLHLHLLPDRSPAGVTQAVGPGYLAVSTTLLTACPNRHPDVLAMVEWLNGLQPVTRTPGFVVFKLD